VIRSIANSTSKLTISFDE
jgi:hypothetical protein